MLDPIDRPEEHEDEIGAAVLLPLVVGSDGLTLLFIRRASTLSRDAGHLAFPGGVREPDEALVATALRETDEEIGLRRPEVDVLGALTVAHRAVDTARVAAFVGVVHGPLDLAVNAAEVEAVLEVPLGPLFAGEVAWEEIWGREGIERPVHFFAEEELFGDDLLWGLSARFLWDFLSRLGTITRDAEG